MLVRSFEVGWACIQVLCLTTAADDVLLHRERREEVMTARKNVFPYLQAEHDLRFQAHREVVEAYEAQVMSDVDGWEVGKCVYKTREWVAPKPKYGAFQYVFD